MKKILLVISCFIVSGCASSKLTSVINTKVPYPYGKVLILTIESNDDFYQLDSNAYNTTIKSTFNRIDNFDFRKQLERTVERNLNSPNTSILKSSDIFAPNSDISYTKFKEEIKDSGAEAVIILNLKSYWNTSSYTINSNVISENKKPNALFIGYLVELKDNKVVWAGKSVVNGTTLAGYDTLNSNLAKKLGSELSKKEYIYAK